MTNFFQLIHYRWTCDFRIVGSSPGHDTAWLFSEIGDHLWRVNYLGM